MTVHRILTSLLALSLQISAYPEYQEFPDQSPEGGGNYAHYIAMIRNNKEIKTVFEIGSRDAKDAIKLSELFRCHVFAFECNPATVDICRGNIGLNPNVTLIPLAVWNQSGSLSFYRVIDGNIGASSCFRFDPEARNYQSIMEEGLIQEEVTVSAIRLDEFLEANNMDSIDLICMDVQGAAFQVLEGLGKYLPKVKYIITELEQFPIYKDEVLYKEVNRFLLENGFKRITAPLDRDGLFGDFLYIHSTCL